MKKLLVAFAAVVAVSFASCGGNTQATEDADSCAACPCGEECVCGEDPCTCGEEVAEDTLTEVVDTLTEVVE